VSDLPLAIDGGLSGLRGPGGDQRERLKKAAAQFEVEFVRLLFKDLERTPIDDEPLLGEDPGTKEFTQLFHDGLGERAAGGLGVAELVFRELSARAGVAQPPSPRPSDQPGRPPGKDQP
jgi:Rod binding domain-containing protein